MSPRGGVNRRLKLIPQIKALNTIISNQPVRPVWPVEQTGQTGPTQNLHKSVNPPLYEL